MTDFMEIIEKNSKVQDDISQTIEKYNNESYENQSNIGKNAWFQSNVFKQTINILGETIADMDIEMEKRVIKHQF